MSMDLLLEEVDHIELDALVILHCLIELRRNIRATRRTEARGDLATVRFRAVEIAKRALALSDDLRKKIEP